MPQNLFSFTTIVKALDLMRKTEGLRLCLHLKMASQEEVSKKFEGRFLRSYYNVASLSLAFEAPPASIDLVLEHQIKSIEASNDIPSLIAAINFFMVPGEGAIFNEINLKERPVLEKNIYLHRSDVVSLFSFWQGINALEARAIMNLVRQKLILEQGVPELNHDSVSIENKKKI